MLNKAKILAELAKLGAEIWGIVQDKKRSAVDRDAKIKELEAEIARLRDGVR